MAKNQANNQTLAKFQIGGLSCGVASTLTNPLDVCRIRLQNQVKGSGVQDGMVSGLVRIVREEGMRGLSRGMYASWAREMTYSSARIGLYDPARDLVSGGETDPAKIGSHVKFVAGFISGSVGSAACNPCDLIKTRQQQIIPEGHPQYGLSNWSRHIFEVKTVLREGGIVGMYKGWQATSARAAVLTSAQLGSYDTVKNNVIKPMMGLHEGLILHFCSSMVAAVFTTTASNPLDVVKTRYMCDTAGRYKNVIDCVTKIAREEGPMAFMKGWLPAYSRVTPHTVITLMMLEALRKLYGMDPL